jgi:hypothetical protein
MSLAILITCLEAALSRNLPRNRTSFAETRARRSELAPFEMIADIRRALDPTSSKLTVDARRALVTALVEEAQKGTSAMVVAFAASASNAGTIRASGGRSATEMACACR